MNQTSTNILQHDQLEVLQSRTRTSRVLKERRNKNLRRARRRRRRRRRRRGGVSGESRCVLRVARSKTVNGTCSRLSTCRHRDQEEFTPVRKLGCNLSKIGNNENIIQDCELNHRALCSVLLTFEEEIVGRCNAFGVCRRNNREIIVLDHPDCPLQSSLDKTSQSNNYFIFDWILYLLNFLSSLDQ